MNSVIQLLVLAGIAVFLILRLRNVLGTREGFEAPRETKPLERTGPALEVIEGGPDPDITDHVEDGSESAKALGEMKRLEPGFGVSDFVQGARGAYEMILMGFERGDLTDLVPLLSKDVYESFAEVIDMREAQGLKIESEFVGVREISLQDATFDSSTNEAEITVRVVGELTYLVRNAEGEVVEGDDTKVKRQKDVWTFARVMGADDPNWQLVATGE